MNEIDDFLNAIREEPVVQRPRVLFQIGCEVTAQVSGVCVTSGHRFVAGDRVRRVQGGWELVECVVPDALVEEGVELRGVALRVLPGGGTE